MTWECRPLIELLDFKLRGGRDAPLAAARVANVTERYLGRSATRDAVAVVTELVAWLGHGDPVPQTLRLELSVTPTTLRVAVTVPRGMGGETPVSNEVLRQTLPVTAALASRYGVAADGRTRVWAEFDRQETD
jgi:hypothetical protein